jgi:uncharacterized membrane protein
LSIPVTARPVQTGPKKKGSLVRRILVAGILVWLPIGVTMWVVTFLVHLLDKSLVLLPMPPGYHPQGWILLLMPAIGLLLTVVMLFVTGILVTNLIGRRLLVWGEELLHHIPIVGAVYGGVKSFAESVFSQSNSFRKVVMIEYPRAGIWSVGFLTAEDVPEISAKTGEPHAVVYISAALNATAGWLAIVPRRQLIELDMSVDAALKMIITCGVVVPRVPEPQEHGELPERAAGH